VAHDDWWRVAGVVKSRGNRLEHFSVPTRTEQDDFLIRLYFGTGSDYLRLCIRRAYLDFNRTLHGISAKPDLYQKASDGVEAAINQLKDEAKFASAEVFDNWHRNACMSLRSIYAQAGYTNFYIGQAQK
jgi:hypothetical protein